MSSIESIVLEIQADPFEFSQDFQKDSRLKEPLPTNDFYSLFLNLSWESFNTELGQQSNKIENQEQRPLPVLQKQKRLIEVSKQKRRSYLESKKGKISNSNDLTTHITALIRSNFEEYKIFFCSNLNQSQYIKQFQKSNDNLKSLRKLLIESRDIHKEPVDKILQTKTDLGENNMSLNDFLSEKFQSRSMVTKILMSKKMCFDKKQALIRYLAAIRKIFDCPETLRSWKGLLMN